MSKPSLYKDKAGRTQTNLSWQRRPSQSNPDNSNLQDLSGTREHVGGGRGSGRVRKESNRVIEAREHGEQYYMPHKLYFLPQKP